MRNSLLFILVALFLLSLAPTSFAGILDLQAGPPVVNNDPGPTRDPMGDDWIFYDDGGNNFAFFTYHSLWGRVSFTPNSEFRLQGIRLRTYNPDGADDPECQIRIYPENGNGGMDHGEDPIWAVSTNDIPNGWWNMEIPEDDWNDDLIFDADESFSICVGPAPANNIWHITVDYGGNGHSYIYTTDDEGALGGNPQAINDNDILIRANGTYLQDFWDLGVVAVYNTEGYDDLGNWIQLQGGESVFAADISNYGNDLDEDEYLINFTVVEPGGEPIFNYDMLGPAIETGDTISIECDSTWAIPEDADVGLYQVYVSINVEGDANNENDQVALDQIVFLAMPLNDDDEHASDVWIGYIPADGNDDLTASNLQEGDGDGRGINLYHPGGEKALVATAVRFAAHNQDADAHTPGLKAGVINRSINQYGWIQELEGATNAEQEFGADANSYDWVEFDLTEDTNKVVMNEGDAIVLMYFTETTSIMLNSANPLAGGATEMPWCMASFQAGGLYQTGLGDFAVQVKLEWADIARIGKYISSNPEGGSTIDFGTNLEWDTDYTTDVVLSSTGSDTVTCGNILIRASVREELFATLENGEDANQDIVIPPGESVTVTIRWHTPTDIAELIEPIQFVTNADEDRRFTINFTGGTLESVIENDRPGIPELYSMGQNYPNPFNPTTSVDFAIVKAGNVSFGVYDMSGRLVKEVFNGELSTGYHSIEINASDLSAGVYFYSLKSNEFTSTRKMVLLK